MRFWLGFSWLSRGRARPTLKSGLESESDWRPDMLVRPRHAPMVTTDMLRTLVRHTATTGLITSLAAPLLERVRGSTGSTAAMVGMAEDLASMVAADTPTVAVSMAQSCMVAVDSTAAKPSTAMADSMAGIHSMEAVGSTVGAAPMEGAAIGKTVKN